MSDAFISYRRKSSAALANLIQRELRSQYGIDAYLDITRTDSTRVQFPERLMTAIADAPTFICLLSGSTLDSEWVRKEIWKAYDLKKHCIPIFQESYEPRVDSDEAIEYLLNFDGVTILDVKNIYIDQAITDIAALIVRRRKPRRLALVIGLLGLLLLVAGIAGAILLSGDDESNDSNDHLTSIEFVQTETRQTEVANITTATDVPPTLTDTPTSTVTTTPTRTDEPPTSTTAPTEEPTVTLTASHTALTTSTMISQMRLKYASGIYETPSTSSDLVTRMFRGDIIYILEGSPDDLWIHAENINGQSGWILTASLETIHQNTQEASTPTSSISDTNIFTETPTSNVISQMRLKYASGIYEAPSTSSDLVVRLYRGDIVYIRENFPNDVWIHVEDINGQSGWILTASLETIHQNTEEPFFPITRITVIQARYLSEIYAQPNTSSDQLGYVHGKEVVILLAGSLDDQWINIQNINGISGWVRAIRFKDYSESEENVKVKYASGIYEAPSTSSALVIRVYQGDVLNILEDSPDNIWVHVENINGLKGWILTASLESIE